MKQRSYLWLFLSLIALTLFFSCKKGDTGPAGAAGPTGANGAPGAPGAQGTQGPKGDTGVANVIYSAWLDVTFDPVVDSTDINNLDTVAWTAVIPAPTLTDEILTKGEMKLYVNAGTASDPAVFPTPITDLFSLLGVLNLNVYFTLNEINLYSTEDASTFTPIGGTEKAFQYRYILIPGVIAGRGVQWVDWKDYNKVKAYFHLKD